MIDRIWWFLSGALTGGFLMARAMRRSVAVRDLRVAAVETGADIMDLAARVIRPRR